MPMKLRESFDRCSLRYPAVDLPYEEFAARIGNTLVEAPSADIHAEDVYLALACSRGDRIAWEHFADDYLPEVRRFAFQACRNRADGEDLAQEIVKSLMEQRARFASYSGRGSLLSWLRVTVARAAIDRFRRERKDVSLEDMQEQGRPVPDRASPQDQAEAGRALDAHWGAIILRQLSDEIRRLPPRDRLLLGLYYVEQVPLRAIAAHFDVHESTASRWITGVRDSVRKRVERELRIRHRLRPRDVELVWESALERSEMPPKGSIGRSAVSGFSAAPKSAQDDRGSTS